MRSDCAIEGCGRVSHSSGLCLMHYKRVRRSGTTEKMTRERRGAISAALLTGKTQSAETCAKRSASLKGRVFTPEHRAKISAALKGKPKSLDARRRMSVAKSGRVGTKLTAEWRMKVSLGHLRVAKRGREHHCFGKAPAHGKRIRYRNTVFRSSYEVAFAKMLDSMGVEWEYERQRFDLGECTYLPDFYLPEYESYYEVKGWLTQLAERKLELFREKFPKVPLILVPGVFIRQLSLGRTLVADFDTNLT